MSLNHHQENAKALAAILGVEEEEAALRLCFRVAITFDPISLISSQIADDVMSMLSRTIDYAGCSDQGEFATEVIIGNCVSRTGAPTHVYAGKDGENFVIRNCGVLANCDPSTPRPLLVIAACYIAAAAIRASLGSKFPIGSDEPIVLPWSLLFGPYLDCLVSPFDIGEAFLAGAGAVGNGFIYALSRFEVSGTLHIADSKAVTPGSLNRCLFFGTDDFGYAKASRLCHLAQPLFPNLSLIPHATTLDKARKSQGETFLIKRLIVGVDSRRARRSLQTELPGAVFDASTTGVTEVVLHFNQQPTELACLSCIYPETDRERSHEENVAEALGLDLQEVQTEFISQSVARKICLKYPGLRSEELTGRAFDTIYKELCGVGKLKDAAGQQVLAPFSFVSVLAGACLAVEFAIRVMNPENNLFNYWRVSPWHSPVPALRQHRPRDPDCEFCSKAQFRRVLSELWPGT